MLRLVVLGAVSRRRVNDPKMQHVNWKRVNCMNLIVFAPEKSERNTQGNRSETINSGPMH